MKNSKREAGAVWHEPTRRTFVTMIGAAAAVLAVPKVARNERKTARNEPKQPPPLPRWIGHL